MQKRTEYALTLEYAKICDINFYYLINQVMIYRHSLTACI